MIDLTVEEYCYNCPMFSVEQDTLVATYEVIHTLKCSNREMCKQIKKHLETGENRY